MSCRRIHTVSVFLRSYLGELGFPTGRMVVVLNGVDCGRFRPADNKNRIRLEIGLPEGKQIIGMVGRFVETKRHLMMLEAFEAFAKRNSDVCLLIVGDGGEFRQPILDAIENHSFRERIHWVGHRDDPLPYYQSMDLLAMPSEAEGLSNALLEAMACGVPAVAHTSCGAGEVIEDRSDGVLKAMNSPADIVVAVSHLLDDPQTLSNLGKRARQKAEESFSLDSMVPSYAELYREVSGRR